jgi:RNA polymerase sigma-70 factor (ECF subfamily)
LRDREARIHTSLAFCGEKAGGFRTRRRECCDGTIVNSNTDCTQAEKPLITRARRGNSEAFSELVRMHSQRVYCVSLRILKNHADAEDNLQDVFCKVYKNIHRFQGRSRFSSWLVRITINEALMKIRRESFARAAGQTDLPAGRDENNLVFEITDQYPDPERQYIVRDLVEKAFHGLHPVLRQTFVLNKREGWTDRELAASMGIAIATVKSRIFRTRARIQHQLQPRC